MITIETVSVCHSEAVSLYESAFPVDERRESAAWQRAIATVPHLHYHEITRLGCFVGFVTVWSFDTFAYIEHFAIDASVRGQHIGTEVLAWLRANYRRPLVVEVEPPTDSTAQRRIAFYQRAGFRLLDYPYMQPPYDATRHSVALQLMTTANDLGEATFATIKECLYRDVYGATPD